MSKAADALVLLGVAAVAVAGWMVLPALGVAIAGVSCVFAGIALSKDNRSE